MTCLFFVTSAIIEFAVLLHLKSTAKYKKELTPTSANATRKRFNVQNFTDPMNQTLKAENDKMDIFEYQIDNHSQKKADIITADQGRLFQEKARKIDRITLTTFTGCFIAFNFVYWTYYLNLIQCIKST